MGGFAIVTDLQNLADEISGCLDLWLFVLILLLRIQGAGGLLVSCLRMLFKEFSRALN